MQAICWPEQFDQNSGGALQHRKIGTMPKPPDLCSYPACQSQGTSHLSISKPTCQRVTFLQPSCNKKVQRKTQKCPTPGLAPPFRAHLDSPVATSTDPGFRRACRNTQRNCQKKSKAQRSSGEPWCFCFVVLSDRRVL